MQCIMITLNLEVKRRKRWSKDYQNKDICKNKNRQEIKQIVKSDSLDERQDKH